MTNSISFDRAADFYDQTRDLAESVATHGLPALLNWIAPQGRILDVGIGTGRIAVPLIDLGADMIGIDLSLKMMAKLREKQPTARLVVFANILNTRTGVSRPLSSVIIGIRRAADCSTC